LEKDMKQAELAQWLSALDDGIYFTKPSAVSSAKKSDIKYGLFPATPLIASLLKQLVKRYPTFEYECLFHHSEVAELLELMTDK
jgi:hypothetical protein